MPLFCASIVHRRVAARGLAILLVLLSLSSGCTGESSQTPPPRSDTSVSHREVDSTMTLAEEMALRYSQPTVDTTYHIRDLTRGDIYTVDYLDEFLVLRSGNTILDTLTLFGVWCDSYEDPDFTQFDSTFLIYEAVCKGNSASGETEIYCVADGRFKLSARFSSHSFHSWIYGSEYTVKPFLSRRPYRLQLLQSFEVQPIETHATAHSYWERRYRLRFDTAGYFFHSDSIRLDQVPIQGENRFLSGVFPGIAVAGKWTLIHADDRWLYLRKKRMPGPDPAREKTFIRGKSKPELSGSGKKGDSLSPLDR
jgi:hypothetical protein